MPNQGYCLLVLYWKMDSSACAPTGLLAARDSFAKKVYFLEMDRLAVIEQPWQHQVYKYKQITGEADNKEEAKAPRRRKQEDSPRGPGAGNQERTGGQEDMKTGGQEG